MIYLTDNELDYIITEDIPIYDLTSLTLDLKGKASITFLTRQDGIVCGTEEVARVFEKFGIEISSFKSSGEEILAGDTLISGIGLASKIHQAWKVSQNILEYMSGIATLTHRFVSKAKAVNPNISIVTTRKIAPGTKKLVLKSIITGGAMPHRLSLSDSVLIFQEHLKFLGGLDKLLTNIKQIKGRNKEKKITLEVSSLEEAFSAMKAGIDVIQFDKASLEDISKAVSYRDSNKYNTLIAAAGGINFDNVDMYAKTGVDIIVTTSLYWAKPLDIKTVIEPMES